MLLSVAPELGLERHGRLKAKALERTSTGMSERSKASFDIPKAQLNTVKS